MTDTLQSIPGFSDVDVDIHHRETVYKGFFRIEKIQLRFRLFQGGWSQRVTRELFIRNPAVAAIMYDPENDLIGLVQQFRIGAMGADNGPWLFEVVAGIAEPGEGPVEVIERELQEEANMTPEKLIPICEYFSSPGGSSESLSLFCALGNLTNLGGIHGLEEEGENIRVVVLPAARIFDQLYSGRFNNAATLICLQWLKMHRSELSQGKYDPA